MGGAVMAIIEQEPLIEQEQEPLSPARPRKRKRLGEVEQPIEARILDRAADLIEEFGWAKGVLARNSSGKEVAPWDKSARRFCATGAIARAWFDLTGEVPSFKRTSGGPS